ncbi:MAG TPA: hypothetical protein V6D22_21930 [Candidatus Obscuribacterales bacterium]
MVFHPIEGQNSEPAHADKAGAKLETAVDLRALPTERVLAEIMPPKVAADNKVAGQDEKLGEGPGKFIKLANANSAVMLNQLLAEHGTEGNVQEAFWPFTSSNPSPGTDGNTKCPDGTQRQSSCDGHTGTGGRSSSPVIVPRAGSSPSDAGKGGTSGVRGGTSTEGAGTEGAHTTSTGAHSTGGEGAHGGFGGGAHGGGASAG